jgi:hypothetical protein
VDSRRAGAGGFERGSELLSESAPVRKHVLHVSGSVLCFGRLRSSQRNVLLRCSRGPLRAGGSVLPEWLLPKGIHLLRNRVMRSGPQVLFRIQ